MIRIAELRGSGFEVLGLGGWEFVFSPAVGLSALGFKVSVYEVLGWASGFDPQSSECRFSGSAGFKALILRVREGGIHNSRCWNRTSRA